MDATAAVLLLAVLAVLAALWVLGPRRPLGFPPGPTPWPWLGNVRELRQMARRGQTVVFDELARRYGAVFGLVLPFGLHMVVVRDFGAMKAAFGDMAFSGRPDVFTLVVRAFMKKQGLMTSEGDFWTEHRRFALRHLKDKGFGKSGMEDQIMSEYHCLSETLRAKSGQNVSLNKLFEQSVINIIWQIIASHRYELGNKRLQDMQATIQEFSKVVGVDTPVNMFPWLRHVAPGWSGFQAAVNHRDKVSGMFSELIRQHEQIFNPLSLHDFVDEFLAEKAQPGAMERGFTNENLTVIGMDLFTAGSDSTSLTLVWTLLLVTRHPHVQRRLQEELDRVVGRHRLPTLGDQARLPYCQAVTQEVLRWSSLVPHAAPHCTSFGAAPLGAHRVPAGAVVLSDLRAVHMDAAHWGDPRQFRPERFVGADGRYRPGDRVVAFGVGRRQCPAEAVARLELFLFTAGLLHQFRVRPAAAATVAPELKPDSGIIAYPPRCSLVFDWRTD